MREVVLDASVLLKWFTPEPEADADLAGALEERYRQGELGIVVPVLAFLEMLNVAARRWRWDARSLEAFAAQMERYAFQVTNPPLHRIAHWAGRGLSAYDACYVALAEQRRTVVVTADERILTVAGALAEPLAMFR